MDTVIDNTSIRVALLAEGVDRNFIGEPCLLVEQVALLAEGVDRNIGGNHIGAREIKVALLAEGVDRNWQVDGTTGRLERSPSSRRAWIEIFASSLSF